MFLGINGFTNDLTPRSKYPKEVPIINIHWSSGVLIGANATIVCGSTIGKCSFVAAGAVVTKDVKDYAVVAGVPARQIGWICECGEILKTDFKCRSCNREYEYDKNLDILKERS